MDGQKWPRYSLTPPNEWLETSMVSLCMLFIFFIFFYFYLLLFFIIFDEDS